MTQKLFMRFFQYNMWANDKVMDSLMTSRQEKAARLFSHLLLSENTWFKRIRGKSSGQMNIWQSLSPREWEIMIQENEKNYLNYISGLSDEDFQHKISYANSKGIEYHTPLADILTHVVMHSVYHRGQIASSLREAGFGPVNTDFIGFARL